MNTFTSAQWLWIQDDAQDGTPREIPEDCWVLFKRTLLLPQNADSSEQDLELRIAAYPRYRIWVNGNELGEGPARSWPDSIFYDSYEIPGNMIVSGILEIEVLVRSFIPGTGISIPTQPGMALELVPAAGDPLMVSDGKWICAEHPGHREVGTKMANAFPHAEIVRADLVASFSNWNWQAATTLGPAIGPKRTIVKRDIPPLADQMLTPAAISSPQPYESRGFTRSVNLRPLVWPGETDFNKHKRFSGILYLPIESTDNAPMRLSMAIDPHDTEPLQVTLNAGGMLERFTQENGVVHELTLKPGSNVLTIYLRGEYHDPTVHMYFDLPPGAALGDFLFQGPLEKSSYLQLVDPIPPATSDVMSAAELEERELSAELLVCLGEGRTLPDTCTPVPARCISPHHVAMEALLARSIHTNSGDNKHSNGQERFSLDSLKDCNPAGIAGRLPLGTEFIVDMGREVSGFIDLEIEGSLGTRLDVFCFESMHDGFIEHTYSLNNSLRYFCREGRQRYSSFFRRGFRYMLISADAPNLELEGSEDITLHNLGVRESLYPHLEESEFSSSDALLDDIWKISRQTVALCMEDTFVDCPAYEQIYWTGDARNTALYSFELFGDKRLFLRCAKLAAGSLERSPLIESMIPSAWQNIIPSWSFFHCLAGAEYLDYADDPQGFDEFFDSLYLNMERAASFLQEMPDGSRLFAMHAWNMLDWAPMDVPDDGIIAHQNAQFFLACRRLAKAAAKRRRPDAVRQLEAWATQVAAGYGRWFWDESKQAYRDSISRDGVPSKVFSVQTQLFVLLSGILDEKMEDSNRRARLIEIVTTASEDFVQIASPFIRHFEFELLFREGMYDRILSTIRSTYGYMIENRATTCWEGWALIPGHHTRSHCHAWSSAPVYFLPRIVLGIQPDDVEGFRQVSIRPQAQGLTHASGSVQTAWGPLSVSWEIQDGRMDIRVHHPRQVSIEIPEDLPIPPGTVQLQEF